MDSGWYVSYTGVFENGPLKHRTGRSAWIPQTTHCRPPQTNVKLPQTTVFAQQTTTDHSEITTDHMGTIVDGWPIFK